MGTLQFEYAPMALGFVHVVLGVAVLVLAKLALSLFSPYLTDQELTTRDNPAFGLALAGYYAGAILIYLGSAIGPLPLDAGANGVFLAIGRDLAWAAAGILALNFSRFVIGRLVVPGLASNREISENRNTAAGALECGIYLSAAIVLSGAIRQPGGNPGTAAALFLIGQCALIVMGNLYRRWAGYDLGAEIRGANLAAGVAFGMTLTALALIMLKAIGGEFTGWSSTLTYLALDAAVGLLLLLFLRWLTDLVLLPNARIAEEIVRDRNVNVGLVEGVLAVGISALILYLF